MVIFLFIWCFLFDAASPNLATIGLMWSKLKLTVAYRVPPS